MKPIKLIVEYQNNDYTKELERELAELKNEFGKLRQEVRRIEGKYADEMHVNLELTDLLRQHGIRFRQSADMRNW